MMLATATPPHEALGPPLPWLSANLFFIHTIQPRFKLFSSCEAPALAEERARVPRALSPVLERLGVEPSLTSYCAGMDYYWIAGGG